MNTNTERVNPFADLSEFETRPAPKAVSPIETAQIDQLAEEHGFPSRQPAKTAPASLTPAETALRPRRRHTTGRNQQINIKATPETIAHLYRLADEEHLPLGELLERALKAFEREQGKVGQEGYQARGTEPVEDFK
jgi:hypothetical protein